MCLKITSLFLVGILYRRHQRRKRRTPLKMMTMQKVTRKASVTRSLTAFLVGISIKLQLFY